ncbi:MAG TPA: peptide deformylase [Allocoleopsis sp.]
MTEILKIAQHGNIILEQKARPIDNINDPEIQRLIDNLIETAKSKNGVGIAAPQVSESYRLFIVASRSNQRYPDAPNMLPIAMINPRIIAHSSEIVKGWEGCLSVPNVRGFVPRYKAIEVEYITRKGEIERVELRDFVARIFQHEYDHLDGILFIDRVENKSELISEEEYQKMLKNAV